METNNLNDKERNFEYDQHHSGRVPHYENSLHARGYLLILFIVSGVHDYSTNRLS